MLFSKKKFDLIEKKVIRLNKECDRDKYDKYFGNNATSKFRMRLKTCPDILIVLLLKFRDFPKYKFIACSTHLHYNPKNPHIKLAQTLMINESLNELVKDEWNLDIDKIPIICCGDFNALPIKTEADEYDPYLKDNESMISGVYQLMTQCKVECDHEDHPKRRIYEKTYRSIYYQKVREEEEKKVHDENENEEEDHDMMTENNQRLKPLPLQQMMVDPEILMNKEKTKEERLNEKRSINIEELAETEKDIEKYPQLQQLEYIENLVDYETNMRWKSVYDTAFDEPIWTNHTKNFSGCIDYIFCNDNFRILSYLEHPTQNGSNHHKVNLQSMLDINNDIAQNNEDTKDQNDTRKIEQEKEREIAENFPIIPNKDYPSDHLCLVSDLELMPTPEAVTTMIKKLQS